MESVQQKIALIRQRYATAAEPHKAALARLEEAKAREIALIQAECPHAWKWHQIAGEGKSCTICELFDLSDD